MLILVVTYTYINRLSYLTLDKVAILNATQICGINNNMQIKTQKLVFYQQITLQKQKDFHCAAAGVILKQQNP